MTHYPIIWVPAEVAATGRATWIAASRFVRRASSSMAWLQAARSTNGYGGWSAGDTHAPTLASSVELLLHVLGARLILQELHVLLELERSELFLPAQGV